MANITRVTSSVKTVGKTVADSPTIRSVRQPSTIQEMGDVDFGILDASHDGKFITYDHQREVFVLTTADQLLEQAVEDANLGDAFIDVLEQEIDLGVISEDIDGGGF